MKNNILVNTGSCLIVKIAILLFSFFSIQSVLASTSLRFYGTPVNDDHRVKIPIDDPANNQPGPPADIGSEDFTLEFWIKATTDNDATAVSPCAPGWYSWIHGNIIIDRDRFNQGGGFGISIIDGVIWFGLDNSTETAYTICGSTNVLDGSWHHIAVQRRRNDGWMQLFVNGTLEAEADGPDGDISYPDDAIPGDFCGGPCDFSDPYLVIGAEKHDANPSVYPAYFGLVDEIRLSDSLRYSTSSFAVPEQPFETDNNTVALYHLDEGSGTIVNDTSGADGGPSNGEIKEGVEWEADTPFQNNGDPGAGVIQFTQTRVSISESVSEQIFEITRSNGNGTAAVNYTIGDTGSTATPGVDYQSIVQTANGTLTWMEGDVTPQTLIVTIDNDTVVENDETVVLTLSNPVGNADLGENSSATLTILDDDSAGTIQFELSEITVQENEETVTISVYRSNGINGMVSVEFQLNSESANEGEDYASVQPSGGVLTFADGETLATISLTLLDDIDPEATESIMFTLVNANEASIGERSSMVLYIMDNDNEEPDTSKPGSKPNSGSGATNPLCLALLLLILINYRTQSS